MALRKSPSTSLKDAIKTVGPKPKTPSTVSRGFRPAPKKKPTPKPSTPSLINNPIRRPSIKPAPMPIGGGAWRPGGPSYGGGKQPIFRPMPLPITKPLPQPGIGPIGGPYGPSTPLPPPGIPKPGTPTITPRPGPGLPGSPYPPYLLNQPVSISPGEQSGGTFPQYQQPGPTPAPTTGVTWDFLEQHPVLRDILLTLQSQGIQLPGALGGVAGGGLSQAIQALTGAGQAQTMPAAGMDNLQGLGWGPEEEEEEQAAPDIGAALQALGLI